MVTNEISSHMHVTGSAEIHEPEIWHFLKRIIRRFTDVEKRLSAHIVSYCLCVLDACQVSPGSPGWNEDSDVSPRQHGANQFLLVAVYRRSIGAVSEHEAPALVTRNCKTK